MSENSQATLSPKPSGKSQVGKSQVGKSQVQVAPTPKPNEVKREPPKKTSILVNNMVYMMEVNRRVNQDPGLFRNYQINPYTKKTLDFTTPKVNTRPTKIRPECVPGYDVIKTAIWKSYATPQQRFCEQEASSHRNGWFEKGQGTVDRENYDDRFKFTHRTADFIRTAALISDYDKLMKGLEPKQPEKAAKLQPKPSQAPSPSKAPSKAPSQAPSKATVQ